MCFRPAAAEPAGSTLCSECGKAIPALGGIAKCPFCKAELTAFTSPMPGAPKPSGVTGAPGAPKSPDMPGAPGMPGSPPKR